MKCVSVPEPARISANETVLREVSQENLIGYSDVVMCFVIPLNVTNVRAASH